MAAMGEAREENHLLGVRQRKQPANQLVRPSLSSINILSQNVLGFSE